MKKIKIGIIIDQLVSGGVQKSAIQEAKELKKLGHDVTLFVLVRLYYTYQYQDLSQGLKVIFLSDYNPIFFKRAYRIPYFAFLTHLHILNPFFARRYTMLKKLDFIISHGTTTCITAAAITKILKVPYMAFIYDPMLYILEKAYAKTPVRFFFPLIKPLTRYYERSFLISAALVVTQSKVHQNFIRENYAVDPIIIHPACVPVKHIPQKISQDILGYTRWEMAKNPQLFLWLAKKLPQAHFLIAGSWSNSQQKELFKSLIKKRKLEKQIELLSPINENKLQQLAAKSLVWVHPHFEAFGMAGLEMASLGLPIIIPKGSGVTELFQEGEHGFFPSLKEKKTLLTHLLFLLQNPTLAVSMGKKAASVAKQHTWTNHSQTVLKHIQTYLSQTKIVTIANGFVNTRSTGGGDHFAIELARRIPKNVHMSVILPKTGLYHWERAGIEHPYIRYLVLPASRFDNSDNPLLLFFAYLSRSIRTLFLLRSLPPFQILYTTTDLFPDTTPVYLFCLINSHVLWFARFFHFIDPPYKREGNFFVNSGAFLLQKLSLSLMKQSDVILIDNPSLKIRLKKLGIQEEKIQTHPGGVNLQAAFESKLQKSFTSDAIFLGRLIPHKGIFDAVDVWKYVTKEIPHVRLFMIGHGPYNITKTLIGKIKQTRLEKNIKIVGYIHDRKTLTSYIKSSKLLLFLDHEAGFGLVIIEAMAAGLPVVAYNLPIFGTTYKQGFLTSSMRDTKSIAKNIISLLTNEKKYFLLSQKAFSEAKRFDWNYASKKFYRTVQRTRET